MKSEVKIKSGHPFLYLTPETPQEYKALCVLEPDTEKSRSLAIPIKG